MNLTLTLLAQSALLAVILISWYVRLDQSNLPADAYWVFTLYIVGGALGLAWLARVALFAWVGW